MPGNHPKETIQHSEQGESLKSRTVILLLVLHGGGALHRGTYAEDVCEYGAEKDGPRRDEWDRGVEETACEEIRDLYFSPNTRWAKAGRQYTYIYIYILV